MKGHENCRPDDPHHDCSCHINPPCLASIECPARDEKDELWHAPSDETTAASGAASPATGGASAAQNPRMPPHLADQRTDIHGRQHHHQVVHMRRIPTRTQGGPDR